VRAGLARPSSRARRAALALAVALLAPACADFPDQSTVTDLRVLAVRAEPSEVILKLDGLPADPTARLDPSMLGGVTLDPASIPDIVVTPLIADVTPLIADPLAVAGTPVTWSVVACPNDPYGAAPPAGMGVSVIDPAGGARTTVGSTLCPENGPNTWAFGGPALNAGGDVHIRFTPAQLLAAFRADLYVDQFGNAHGGFDLGLPINVQLTVTDGVRTVLAIKRVLVWARPLPDQTANVAPTIPAVDVYRDRDPVTWAPVGPVTTLDAIDPEHVAVGQGLYLRPWLLPQDRETYATTVIDRDTHLAVAPAVRPVERIRYAFYATAGKFDPPRTVSELLPGVPGQVHLESKYVPPARLDELPLDAATGTRAVTFWIVVRDDRGGESWLERQLALDPPAP
jgi:hypothetical protein